MKICAIIFQICSILAYFANSFVAKPYSKSVMSRKKNQSKKEKNSFKIAVVSLAFQTNWGLKNIFGTLNEFTLKIAKEELECIQELGLVQEILSLKMLVQDVKSSLNTTPAVDYGDFCDSIVALALGICDISDTSKICIPAAWQTKTKKKILAIHYPDNIRNKVSEYLTGKNYNVSTYLGKPIVKLGHLFILIERATNYRPINEILLLP